MMFWRPLPSKGIVCGLVACLLYLSCSATSAEEIIVDNEDAGTSSTGQWVKIKGRNKVATFWGASSLKNKASGRFKWIPDIKSSGDYTVYAWWTYGRKRSSKAPYRIADVTGITKIQVDQSNKSLGGRWNKLGVFTFEAGSDGYIELSGERKQVSADAVRLVKIEPPPPVQQGFSTISDQDWDETAVRKVLHTFAYGGQATDMQLQVWADMVPELAIAEMLTFSPHNDKLSPPEDATRNTDGTLEGLQVLWSSDSIENPVRPDRRVEFDILKVSNGISVISDNKFQKTWIQAAATRGLNPFRQKTGLFLTNYLMAISLDNLHAMLMQSFYDDAMTALERGADFSDILAQGALSAAVALNYGHNTNVYAYLSDGTGVFLGNDDFAREIHQLFFRINGTSEDAAYHENTTIEHTAWILTGMGIDREPLAFGSQFIGEWWVPGIVFEDHLDQLNISLSNFTKHFSGCLEVMHSEICGRNAEEKIYALSKVAIQHQESLDNLPIYIIGFFADDNITDSKAQIIRQAWRLDPRNLLEFLRAYAVSTIFHQADTIKYRTAFDRNLLLDNLNVLSNEEKFALGSSSRTQLQLEGVVAFRPVHAVFGGQTGLESSANSEIFRLAYQRNVLSSHKLGVAVDVKYPGSDGTLKVWKKDWASVIPRDVNGIYDVANVGRWLWNRFIGDGGKNYNDLETSHVEALLSTGLNFNNPLIESGAVSSAIELGSEDPGAREEANRRVGLAVNFITMTPYMFAQEGK